MTKDSAMAGGTRSSHAARTTSTPRRLADFTTDPRTLTLVAMALAVGTAGAAAAWILVKLIALVTNLVWFGRLSTAATTMVGIPRNLWMVAAPALGGLIIGLMARYGTSKIRGHGIPEAIETILIGNSRIGLKVAILKPLSSAIAIGTGGPFGAEGPIIMTGGALGSLFAQFFDLSAAERKTLLVAGAVAGMTTIFGTPVAAVLLAVELLLFEWKPRSFIPVSIAAIVAISWRPLLFGTGPLFPYDTVPLLPWWGLLPCVGLGIICGLQSGLFTVLLYKLEDGFERLPIHWMWWPILGGLVVGLGGLLEPRALGVGYDVIEDLMHNRMAAGAVLLLLAVKAVIWLVALSSGTSGGVLAPLLILGGALGWLVGLALPGDPSFWALLAMAAMLGGTMRAPLTGALFAVELTGNVHILAPLLAATVASYAVTVLLLKRSILTEKIARRGQHITREYSIDPYELTRASEIMVTAVETLPASMPIDEVVALFVSPENKHLGYPIVDAEGRFVGTVTRSDALRWRMEASDDGATLHDKISDAAACVAHPDDVVGHVADLMIANDAGQIAIVDPVTAKLRGIITGKDLLRIRRTTGVSERERARFFRSRPHARPMRS